MVAPESLRYFSRRPNDRSHPMAATEQIFHEQSSGCPAGANYQNCHRFLPLNECQRRALGQAGAKR
ncbi:hypothetical protein GCM10007160_43190 [Litchfieldella qijiaojingensis]|uniref:Uncharacterized protein n=1 Tax=Litchfieldella qijiaojingensis TaxID=980347 RepID=A0ABQ2ZFL7_9GAMM|nr:hypothetical protein GCM10007160_43190 [Halomonas qijiaojingensis]